MRYVLSLVFLVLLAACRSTNIPFPVPPSDTAASSSVDSSTMQVSEPNLEVRQETGNVSYRGVVQPLGISLYMQGTHRLALKDDRFVLLEGPAVDLNEYLGEEVEVFGAVRPTVEAGGVIMRVERISRTTVRSATSSSSVSSRSSLSSSLSSSFSSSLSSSFSSSLSSFSSLARALEKDASVAMMAKEKLAREQWTQEYCSPHVGFCVPIHRNWWFKSFGAT
ncbi:hypothetical protein HY464_03190, partial [Candidatus Peregrinibacteria bacterium]|nr:hypothetical protein [Candidatus Peregrinibacteria bacterium]